ncbi:ABC transporter ATP-binding protein [Mycolicibacterium sp.]|uniref:ABC transporter ATP-binding protein n=1 Tax=Mycolicibacterium sp. TaxID=2320850 RepID=UPI003D095E7B
MSTGTTREILRADRIVVRFGDLVAVNEVSLQVAAGETVGLIGPNGAGKTTFFNAITGYITSAKGALSLGATDLSGAQPWVIARSGVVRTFQNRGVFPGLSVNENLRVARAAQSGRAGYADTAVLDSIEDEVRRNGNAKAGELAYGQQRFLSMAMALATKPKFLLLDEPAAGLNPAETVRVGELLREASSNGVGVVLVEHDMEFLMPLVGRVYVLDAGKTIAVGRPEEVQADEAVHKAYLGGPTSNA